jgi:hypothetical protein
VMKYCQGRFLIVVEFAKLLQDRETDGSAAVCRSRQLGTKSGELHISVAFEISRFGRHRAYA